MRPYLDKILEEQGIEGVITFLQNIGPDGIHLVKRETEVLVNLLTLISNQIKEEK